MESMVGLSLASFLLSGTIVSMRSMEGRPLARLLLAFWYDSKYEKYGKHGKYGEYGKYGNGEYMIVSIHPSYSVVR